MLERVLERERLGAALALAAVTAVAWAYIAQLAGDMSGIGRGAAELASPAMQAWSATALLLLFFMWVVMMVAMMLPAAAPVVLLFDAVARRRAAAGRPHARTAVFVLGYLAAWTGYSALATAAQWGLHTAALLSTAMASTSGVLGGALLIGAGLFQWTPLKQSCLRACRSPLGWLTSEWREGRTGALVMGVRHGAYCVGCCWALMALLFVAGVMNLLWVAALAALVLVEKIAPAGERVSRGAGVALVAWGAWLILARGG